MKIVLSMDEVNNIIVNYLLSNGKLDDKETYVNWHAVNNSAEESYVEVEQYDKRIPII